MRPARVITSYSIHYTKLYDLVLSQKATPSKNGEIATVREMLDVLNLRGAVVTLVSAGNAGRNNFV